MKEISFNKQSEKVIEILKGGAFLTTQADGKLNTMTIGWGGLCYAWMEPIFMVMVRQSRFTYELLEKSNEFTISLPFEMENELKICGTKSGKNFDKFKELGLKTVSSKKISTPLIDCSGIHYECEVVYKQAMQKELLDKAIDCKCYSKGDYHVIYYGKILATYEN